MIKRFLSLILIVIAIFGPISIIKTIEYENHKKNNISYSSHLVDLFGYNTDIFFKYLDQYLKTLRYELQRNYNVKDVELYIKNNPYDKKFITMVNVFDINGFDIYTTLGPGPFQYNYKENDYFKFHLNENIDKIFISQLAVGKISKKLYFRISRRIYNPDGSFWGVINVGVDPLNLSDFYETLNIQKDSNVSLLNLRSKTIIARNPFNENISIYMDTFRNSKIWDMFEYYSSGTYNKINEIDGLQKTFYYKILYEYGLALTLGMSDKEFEKDMYPFLNNMILGGFLLTIIIFSLYLKILSLKDIREKDIIIDENKNIQFHKFVDYAKLFITDILNLPINKEIYLKALSISLLITELKEFNNTNQDMKYFDLQKSFNNLILSYIEYFNMLEISLIYNIDNCPNNFYGNETLITQMLSILIFKIMDNSNIYKISVNVVKVIDNIQIIVKYYGENVIIDTTVIKDTIKKHNGNLNIENMINATRISILIPLKGV